ncbi:MAG: hypothetical protein FWC68_03820, partial [Oscillospiraceae bacterium]|nr:hypothetical protein [Oscillospiraceae bacterium]
ASLGQQYQIPINRSGLYQIIVTNRNGIENTSQLSINLANMPRLRSGLAPIRSDDSSVTETQINRGEWYHYLLASSTNWAFGIESGTTYVWIPRFAYYEPSGRSTTN